MQPFDVGRSNIIMILLMTILACAAHAGAQQQDTPPDAGSMSTISFQADEALEFKNEVSGLADQLIGNLPGNESQRVAMATGLLVCTFVDLKKMYRTSSFGRYLAEQLMSEFQQRNFKVMELRKSISVQVEEKFGEYGLSRDPAEIKRNIVSGAMLTGTYMPTDDHVIVNARIMDNRNAALLTSAVLVFPRNALIDKLLADAATALKKPRGPLYMKRLEL